ncbi:hypothetical protein [Candidatus Ichthyocystis hellenicum]|uniref:hypothetical protein n=1 Tax=Candidatus Ichthyocystis hellenicum TaxID=1561003 RepID=UPI000B887CB9|nr:hypothetical protein [Candidatus Ichthyocystis hellenicum]
MNITGTATPRTLLELSSEAVFGFGCGESIEQFSQLPAKDVIKASILVKHKQLNLSKYESVLDLEGDDSYQFFYSYCNKISCSDCNSLSYYDGLCAIKKCLRRMNTIIDNHNMFLRELPVDSTSWMSHPVYRVIYSKDSKDIVRKYYEERDKILSLPLQTRKKPATEGISYYRDPLFFLSKVYLCHENNISLLTAKRSLQITFGFLSSDINSLISTLKENCHLLERAPYAITMASTLQVRNSASLLLESLSKKNEGPDKREKSIMESLDVIVCLRDLCRDIKAMEERIAPIMQYNNFIALEDRVEILRKITPASDTGHCSTDSSFLDSTPALKAISSHLKMKLPGIVTKRKLRIKHLLEKINLGNECKLDGNFLEQIFMESINSLLEKINLSKEPKSEERDEKLLNPDLIEKSNYLLEKIDPSNKCGSDGNFSGSFFMEAVLLSVKEMVTEIAEIEKTLEGLPEFVDLGKTKSSNRKRLAKTTEEHLIKKQATSLS